MSRIKNNLNWLCDLAFILLTACFAYLAMRGILDISAGGALLDSDLQTYAQGMAGAANQTLFAADPVLCDISAANSIPNLERALAAWLTPGELYAVGLLKAGACAIFIFYLSWYILGRWLFNSPCLSALLAIVCGITVWVGWGTFWGVTHSDPVPRVFFAALFPILLLAAFYGLQHVWFRPIAMFFAGSAMWVHGINALNCGAIFFIAFLFIKPANISFKSHGLSLFLSLIAFFVPVLIYLWPSLLQKRNFSQEELIVFKELFALRWHDDYSNFGDRLLHFFSWKSQIFPLFIGGISGWFITYFKGSEKEKLLCRAIPLFMIGLFIVTFFCWLETWSAPKFGRVPMGHELVRGLRLLVPFCWLMIVCGIGCITGVVSRRLITIVILILIIFFNIDRQYMAVQYAIWQFTGLKLHLVDKAINEKNDAENYRDLMAEINRIVPPGQAIYSTGEDMAVRYLAKRPLIHTFKDGYAFYYNKDFNNSRNWLEYEKIIRSDSDGQINAWLKSQAPWLLCKDNINKAQLFEYGNIVLDKNGWLLVHRKDEANKMAPS